jgi:hypothetical protein
MVNGKCYSQENRENQMDESNVMLTYRAYFIIYNYHLKLNKDFVFVVLNFELPYSYLLFIIYIHIHYKVKAKVKSKTKK